MLWVVENTHFDAINDFRIRWWLDRQSIPHEIVTDWSAVVADQSAVVIISGGPFYHHQKPDLIEALKPLVVKNVPIFGICLGSFCLANLFGADTYLDPEPESTVTVQITHSQEGIFKGIPSPCMVIASHREKLNPADWPPILVIDSFLPREILAWHHEVKPLWGVSFHPEHSQTEGGNSMLRRFLVMNSILPPGIYDR
jgi:anthranilate/para-aminobenzoate synthase component II